MLSATDLLGLRFASEPAISADGTRAAFVVTGTAQPEGEANGRPRPPEYRSAIWLSRDGRPAAPLTSGQARDFAPAFSPDGTRLAFLSTRPVPDGREGEAQVFVVGLDGGEARQVTRFKGGASGVPLFSPDGRRVAVLSRDALPRDPGEKVVVTELSFKADGLRLRGLRSGPPAVWLVDVETGEPELAFQPPCGLNALAWLPDGGLLLAMPGGPGEQGQWKSQLYRLGAPGATPERLTEFDGDIGTLAVAPDGTAAAFIGGERTAEYPSDQRTFVVDLTGPAPHPIRPLDEGLDATAGSVVGGDAHFGAYPAGPYALEDGAFVVGYTFGGFVKAVRLAAGQAPGVLDLAVGERHLAALAVNGAGQVAALVEDVNALAEGAVALDAGAALVPVTDLNPARQTRVERLSLQREGFTVEGWLMFPAGFEPGARFPLIHSIHGGPATTVGGAFTFEHQFLAGHGYAVLLGNIRGSAGYGPAQTAGILGTYGLGDADDLTALLDAVLERYAWIDPQRVAAVGGSYGGFMVNWLSGHSDRYACAITERSICNWVSFWGTSDIGFNFATREHGTASVTADAEALWERSPLKYVDRVKLPTLIIHSEEDHRCPIEQAEQWFVALRQRGVPVRFVRFPDESHDLSRSGRPDRRVARLGEILGWLDAHLKAGEPDTAPGEGR